jgi:hypothetical protein
MRPTGNAPRRSVSNLLSGRIAYLDNTTYTRYRPCLEPIRGGIAMDISEAINDAKSIFDLVTNTPASAILSAVGLILLILGVGIAVRALKDPSKMPFWLQAGFFACIIGGVLFSAAGPSLALFSFSKDPIVTIPAAKAFDNLETNVRVNWLIRLIPFDPQANPELAIGRLTQLGPPDQQYTFVAAYDELVGYRVDDVIRMIGGTYSNDQHVSAIIFPVQNHLQVYPANARGLLQVIQSVEMKNGNQIAKPLLKGTPALSQDEQTDLSRLDALIYWSWDNYSQRFPHYCALAEVFRCDSSYSAHHYIGPVNIDWHPLGFAQRNASQDSCSPSHASVCAISSWKSAETSLSSNFGSRAFLIKNLTIDTIANRVLIDFGDPAHQYIPDIGLRNVAH